MRSLPDVITLAPDYGAELPLWGNGFGNIAWQYTKFSRGLLDRLAAWQQEFDAHCHWDRGWESDEIRDRWASQAEDLAADVHRARHAGQARCEAVGNGFVVRERSRTGRSVRSRPALAMNNIRLLSTRSRPLPGPPVVPQILLVALRLTGGGALAARRGRLPVVWRAFILLYDVSRQSAMRGHVEALLFGPCTDLAAAPAAGC